MALQRRSVLQGMTGLGLTAGLTGLGSTAASAKGASAAGSSPNWAAFDKAVRAEFVRQKLVGAAVAIVSGDRILHQLTMGARDGGRAARITPDTHFLVASTTKSMSSLLGVHLRRRRHAGMGSNPPSTPGRDFALRPLS